MQAEIESKSKSYMDMAFDEALEAARRGEVPVGAVIVLDGKVIARNGNRIIERADPTAHAELLAIREAAATLSSERLLGADLYVTLEPCPMCAHAVSLARLRRLYFSAYDPKSGGVEQGAAIFSQSSCHHVPEIFGGIDESRGQALLSDFFAAKRERPKDSEKTT